MGVSAPTGMCVHCQPLVTERNKPKCRIPSGGVKAIVRAGVPSAVTCGDFLLF